MLVTETIGLADRSDDPKVSGLTPGMFEVPFAMDGEDLHLEHLGDKAVQL